MIKSKTYSVKYLLKEIPAKISNRWKPGEFQLHPSMRGSNRTIVIKNDRLQKIIVIAQKLKGKK